MAYGGERIWRQRRFYEIHKQGIDALVKVLGPVRLRSGSSRYMIREAAITPKIRKQWLEADPDKYLAAVIAHRKKKSRA